MKKLLAILIIISFLTVSACVKPEENLSEKDHDKTTTEKEQEENTVNNEEESIVSIAGTPVCTTCNPYIFKDKRIILNNGELIVNGIESVNFPESTVNCFVYTIHNRMVFTDSGVYEFPD